MLQLGRLAGGICSYMHGARLAQVSVSKCMGHGATLAGVSVAKCVGQSQLHESLAVFGCSQK